MPVLVDLAEVGADAGDVGAADKASAHLGAIAEDVDRHLDHGLAGIGRAWAALAGGQRNQAATSAQ
jgi:hypothetical protein